MSWKKRCYSYYINCHKTYDLECELNRLNYINVLLNEYSCAVTPQVRQTGNRLSGLAGTAYASLLT